jgi:hypothetical protein
MFQVVYRRRHKDNPPLANISLYLIISSVSNLVALAPAKRTREINHPPHEK